MAKQRISYVPVEQMDAEMRREMERCQREGTPRPESSAVRAHVPECFWAFANSWRDIFRNGVCDHSIKELCRLYVSRSVQCEYCGNQRSIKAAASGAVMEDHVKDLLNFEKSSNYDERQKAALAYAEAITWHLNTDDAFWDRLHRHFSEPELVELGCFIALTMGQQSWLRLLGIDHHQVLAAASVAQALAAVRFQRIDVLCNIAGGFRMGKPVHETPENVWELMLDLNAKSVINTARAVVPKMLAAGRGKIINIGAVAGLSGKANMGAYSAAKSAVIRLTESMSAELRDKGINVNCVLPSVIDTPQNRAKGAASRRTPADRAGRDSEPPLRVEPGCGGHRRAGDALRGDSIDDRRRRREHVACPLRHAQGGQRVLTLGENRGHDHRLAFCQPADEG